MKTLVLVAGHAVPYRFDQLNRDAGWYLKPFQAGEGSLYLEHVKRGVEIAAARTDNLLIFAGGQTDAAAGPRSEGGPRRRNSPSIPFRTCCTESAAFGK